MTTEKRCVFVTGASSGIGRAVAVELSSKYDLILNGRDLTRLEETRRLCSEESDIKLFQADISNVGALASSLTEFIKSNELSIWGLVHCAGLSRLLPVRSTGLNDLTDTFNTNVFAPFLLVKTLTSRRVNGDGLKNVVFISSNISNRGSKAFAAYGASKAGLDGLMRCLAVELAPAVRVNSVLPGAVHTRMTEKIFSNEEVVARMKAKYPLGIGQVTDISGAVAFLLSDKAGWITGQQLTVDGGATIDISG